MRSFIAILAAAVLWTGAAHAADGFRIGPTYYSDCKAAEPYAYSSGQPDPVYKEHCLKPRIIADNQPGADDEALAQDDPDADRAQAREEPASWRSQSPQGRDNWNEAAKALQEYKAKGGVLWNVQGPMHHVYKHRQAPEGAVPCQPPGFDHVVLCVKRGTP